MRWHTSQPAAGFSDAAPWEALGDDPLGTDVASQAADPDSLLSTYRSLVGLRRSGWPVADPVPTAVGTMPTGLAGDSGL